MSRVRSPDYDRLQCSFCHRSQEAAGKLLSSPKEYPRAYICDQCVEICMAIIEEDRAEAAVAPNPAGSPEAHPLLSHPLASELMTWLTRWIAQESLGQPAAEELGRVREVASRMLEN